MNSTFNTHLPTDANMLVYVGEVLEDLGYSEYSLCSMEHQTIMRIVIEMGEEDMIMFRLTHTHKELISLVQNKAVTKYRHNHSGFANSWLG